MVVPVPATVADAGMIKRIGDADMNAEIADMRACSDASGPSARPSSHRADLRACANLGGCGAAEENRDRNQGSSQSFHFPFLRDWNCVRLINE